MKAGIKAAKEDEFKANTAASAMQTAEITRLRLCPQRSPSQPKSSRITACEPMKIAFSKPISAPLRS